METLLLLFYLLHLENSDPTYEAWKLCFTTLPFSNFMDSDPTYEAWKHVNIGLVGNNINDSDPTYEAWKLRNH